MNLNYAVRCSSEDEYYIIKGWLKSTGFKARRGIAPLEISEYGWYDRVGEDGAHFIVNFKRGVSTYASTCIPEGMQIISGGQFLDLRYNNTIKAIIRKGWDEHEDVELL